MQITNGKKSSNLVESHELICNFIRLYQFLYRLNIQLMTYKLIFCLDKMKIKPCSAFSFHSFHLGCHPHLFSSVDKSAFFGMRSAFFFLFLFCSSAHVANQYFSCSYGLLSDSILHKSLLCIYINLIKELENMNYPGIEEQI